MRYEAALSECPQQFIQFACFVNGGSVSIDPVLLSVGFLSQSAGKLQTAALACLCQNIKIYASV
jgi:hypothetical protein